MVDVVDGATRSRMMSSIQGKILNQKWSSAVFYIERVFDTVYIKKIRQASQTWLCLATDL